MTERAVSMAQSRPLICIAVVISCLPRACRALFDMGKLNHRIRTPEWPGPLAVSCSADQLARIGDLGQTTISARTIEEN